MKIAKDTVVGLAYQVRTHDDILVDETTVAEPLEYLHGHHFLIPGLEKALEGHQAGDKFDVDIVSADAYGDFNENLVQNVSKDVFVGVDELKVGMRFLADTEHGSVPIEITTIDGDRVTVDGNHMLAGQDLKFHVEIMGVRPATAEEISHGHLSPEEHGHDNDGCCGNHSDSNHSCCRHDNSRSIKANRKPH